MTAKRRKVAVYGSLLKGLSNHQVLKDANLVGEYETEPVHKMFAVTDSYPGVIENGNTSITMEVYEVDSSTLKSLDTLEGYKKSNAEEENYYNRKSIETPFGSAFCYFFNNSTKGLRPITSGSWREFLEYRKIDNYAN